MAFAVGACYKEPRVCIVTEFMENGNLEEYMEKRKKMGKRLSIKRILRIALDIARGLNWSARVAALN